MKTINAELFWKYNPTKLGEVTNQLGQIVQFYQHPDYEVNEVVGVIDSEVFLTGFEDTYSFNIDSEFNPIKLGDCIGYAYDLEFDC